LFEEKFTFVETAPDCGCLAWVWKSQVAEFRNSKLYRVKLSKISYFMCLIMGTATIVSLFCQKCGVIWFDDMRGRMVALSYEKVR